MAAVETTCGWAPDPYCRHEARYFSAGKPTYLVRDGGRDSYEPDFSADEVPSAGIPTTWNEPGQFSRPASAASPAAPAVPGVPAMPVYMLAPPDRPKRHVVVPLVVAIAMVALVAGVVLRTRRDSSINTAKLIASGPETTARQGTAHFASTVTVSGRFPLRLTMTGNTDFRTHASEVHYSANEPNTISESFRYVGGAEYLQASFLALPKGAHWVKILPQDLGLSDLSDTSSGLGSGDPAQGLRFLGDVVGSPSKEGDESLGGIATTHYTLVLNLTGIFAHVSKAEASLSSTLSLVSQGILGQNDLSSVPGDVWLDHAGRVRRLGIDLTLSLGGIAVHENSSTDFSDFGVPVDVVPPAEADTVPFSAVQHQVVTVFSAAGGRAP